MQWIFLLFLKKKQHFKPNPYFTNEVLSKEIVIEGSGEASIEGTEIKWKPGKVCYSQEEREFPHP